MLRREKRKLISEKSSHTSATSSDVEFKENRISNWVNRQRNSNLPSNINQRERSDHVKFDADGKRIHISKQIKSTYNADILQKSSLSQSNVVSDWRNQNVNEQRKLDEYCSYLNPNLSVDKFLDATFNYQLLHQTLIARYVVSKELPHFTEDPKDWPAFITKFRESTS